MEAVVPKMHEGSGHGVHPVLPQHCSCESVAACAYSAAAVGLGFACGVHGACRLCLCMQSTLRVSCLVLLHPAGCQLFNHLVGVHVCFL
jgi:hypothetical protein